MTWNDAAQFQPNNLNPCVALVRDSLGFWNRVVAQCDANGKWFYIGTDAQLRGVEWWVALPRLPLPTVSR
jgi:hypothetical protein